MEENDNLEQFFEKKFAQNPTPEPWNTPDDAVWNNIEAGIAHKKEGKKRLWFILPLCIAALSLFMAGYYYGQTKYLQAQLRTTNNALMSCQTGCNTKEAAEGKSANLPPSNTNSTSLETSTPQKNRTGGKGTNINDARSQGAHLIKKEHLKNQYLQSIVPLPDSSGQGLLHENAAQDAAALKTHQALSTFLPRKIELLPSFCNTEIAIQVDSQGIFPNKLDTKNPSFQVGFAGQFLMWNNRIKGQLDLPLSELLTKENTKNSLSFGITVRKSLSPNWALDGGALYSYRNQTSTYALAIPYTTSTEAPNANGEFENTFNHSLPTGLGFVNTELTLSRAQNSPVTDQEPINIDFAFDHQKQVLHVPLKLSFFPNTLQKGFFCGAGIQTEFVLQNKLNIQQAKSNHTFIHEKNAIVSFPNNAATKVHVSALVDIGYQFPLMPKLNGLVQMGYQIGLSKHYAANAYTHKIDAFSLGIGILRGF